MILLLFTFFFYYVISEDLELAKAPPRTSDLVPTKRFQTWADHHIAHSQYPLLILMLMNNRYAGVAYCYREYFRAMLNMSLGIVFYTENMSQPAIDKVEGISHFCMYHDDCHIAALCTKPFGCRQPADYHFRLTLLYMLSQLRNIRFLVSDADIAWFRVPWDYLEKVLPRYDVAISQEKWPNGKYRLNVGLMGGDSARPGTKALFAHFAKHWHTDQAKWFQGHANDVLLSHPGHHLALPASVFAHHPHRRSCGTNRELECKPPVDPLNSSRACYHYICVSNKEACLFQLLAALHAPTGACLRSVGKLK
eukprot:EG_transcript_19533